MILAALFVLSPVQDPPAAPAEAPKKPQILALEGATVHTMIPGEAPRVATVIVEGERIRSVGLGAEIPADAIRMDLAGKHLIPGLIDGMVNHDPDHDRLYVTAGVTLVRDVGNDLLRILAERDKSHASGARDRGPGPAILCAGAVLDGPNPATTSSIVLGTPEEAEAKIARLLELEPDFLSFHAGLPPPVWRKVIDVAHAAGVHVWGPRLPGVDLARILESGQDGLYHLEAFLPAGKNWPDVGTGDLAGALQSMTGKPLAITPTLSIFARRLVFPKGRPAEFDYLGPIYVRSWLADVSFRGAAIEKDENFLRRGLAVVEMQGRLLKALHERGVKLVPGSAAPNPWLLPGDSLVDELSMWTRAGIPAQSVLECATSRAARALGVAADRGTIEAGKIADLVVLARDPTLEIQALHGPETVVLRGHVLTRAFMDSLREGLAERQRALQEAASKPLSISEPELPPGEVLLRGVVETRAMEERISGESYAVVRQEDGSLVYCAHVVTPGSATVPDTDVRLRETLKDGLLTQFSVEIQAGQRVVSVQGIQSGNVMNVERRIDGAFQGNVPVREPLAFVDVGSATVAMALAQRPRLGPFKALFFDDLDPAVGNWELRLDKDGTHLARTQQGALKVRFGPDGSIAEMQREMGRGLATTKPVAAAVKSGNGLPVLEKKSE
ncbi:MAG: amidohydrolase family protein [Planctomycetota bacterium]